MHGQLGSCDCGWELPNCGNVLELKISVLKANGGRRSVHRLLFYFLCSWFKDWGSVSGAPGEKTNGGQETFDIHFTLKDILRYAFA